MLPKTPHCADLIHENVLCGFYWAYHGLLLTLGSSCHRSHFPDEASRAQVTSLEPSMPSQDLNPSWPDSGLGSFHYQHRLSNLRDAPGRTEVSRRQYFAFSSVFLSSHAGEHQRPTQPPERSWGHRDEETSSLFQKSSPVI